MLQLALKQLPDLIGELRGYIEPGKTGTTSRSAPGITPNAPLNVNPVDDADELYATLREHAACIADALDTAPPSTIAWTRGRENGLPANTAPETGFVHARSLARFIEHQLPMVRDDDLIGDIEHDIVRRWKKAAKKYPSRAPKEHVPVRCAHCEMMLVYKHPPRSFGSDETFVCDSCGKWHTEQELAEQRVRHVEESRRKGRAA